MERIKKSQSAATMKRKDLMVRIIWEEQMFVIVLYKYEVHPHVILHSLVPVLEQGCNLKGRREQSNQHYYCIFYMRKASKFGFFNLKKKVSGRTCLRCIPSCLAYIRWTWRSFSPSWNTQHPLDHPVKLIGKIFKAKQAGISSRAHNYAVEFIAMIGCDDP